MNAAMPTLWKKPITVQEINRVHRNTMCERVGIEFIEVTPDSLVARMPVDERTVQPAGILHGGASVTLAETLGSLSAILATEDGFQAVGLDINANHIRPIRSGWVTGRSRAVHVGRSTQVWQIEIHDEQGRLACTSRITMAVVPAAATGVGGQAPAPARTAK
jgi:1,4-dihydroxy-2-naphthoyl-CoA hydrolase